MQYIVRNHKRVASIALLLLLLLALLLALPAQAQDTDSDDMMDEGVFVSIRLYDGIDPADMPEIRQLVYAEDGRDGFLEILRAAPGYVGYYRVIDGEDQLGAITLFETAEQAAASNEMAREYVVEYMTHLLPNPPVILEGALDIHSLDLLESELMMDEDMDEDADEDMDDMSMDDEVSGLYASVRVYDGFDMMSLEETVATVNDGFLPLLREAEGFFGYLLMHGGEDGLGAASIYVSEEAASASTEAASDFVAENLADVLPEDPFVVSGEVIVASLAALHEGENLIDEMMMEEDS